VSTLTTTTCPHHHRHHHRHRHHTTTHPSTDAAYTFAEGLGVRFELAGEILPDPTAVGGLPLGRYAHSVLPDMAAFAPSPLFDYRGLQPFHDFPEGPDWWDTQHYKQIITQLSKMKANFLGLHTCKIDLASESA
jgi:hypothetical protein